MKSCFSLKIEADISEPDFSNASVPLAQIANKIATEARKNIRNQTNVNGSPFAKLSVKTIKDKIREGSAYPRRALFRKGIMYRAIHVYKLNRNNFAVGIIPRGIPQRDVVAKIHQEIGPIIRKFLGFNAQTYKWAAGRMKRWVSEQKQKSKRRKYNISF